LKRKSKPISKKKGERESPSRFLKKKRKKRTVSTVPKKELTRHPKQTYHESVSRERPSRFLKKGEKRKSKPIPKKKRKKERLVPF